MSEACTAADVGAVMHAFKPNLGSSGISGGKRAREICSKRGDAEDAAASSDGGIALAASSGMQELYTSFVAETG